MTQEEIDKQIDLAMYGQPVDRKDGEVIITFSYDGGWCKANDWKEDPLLRLKLHKVANHFLGLTKMINEEAIHTNPEDSMRDDK